MDAPVMIPKHHKKQEVCITRAAYREGRKQKAVKVYTVNQESCYLLIQGVPSVGATNELLKLFALYGAIEEYRILDDYPCEEFTDVYWVKYKKIPAARYAKCKLDDYSFLGGVLHVCYAPEYETIEDTREKLQDRRKVIAAKTRPEHTLSEPVSDGSTNAERENTKLNYSNNLQRESFINNTNFGNSQRHGGSQQQHSYKPTGTGDSQLQTHIPIESLSSNPLHGRDSHHNAQHHDQSTNIQSQDSSQKTVIPDIPLTLPPPPRDCHVAHSYSKSTYEFARVPSAHATLPAEFQQHNSLDSYTTEHSDQREGGQRMEQRNDPGDSTGSNMSITGKSFVKDKTGNINDKHGNINDKHGNINDKHGNINVNKDKNPIVRKHEYTGTTPKFVPRQTLNSTKKAIGDAHSESNKKLRQQTFQLGDIKGPFDKNKTEVQGGVSSPSEESVVKTIQTIRKRLTQFSDEGAPEEKYLKKDNN